MAVNIFCLPHGGSSASAYNSWKPILAKHNIQVTAIDYYGHGEKSDKQFSNSLEEEAERVYEEILSSKKPVDAIFGHSMGAIILYQLISKRWLDMVKKPIQLFFSGTYAPYYKKRETEWHKSSDQTLIAHMREMGGTPEIIFQEPSLLEYFIGILRNDYKLIETYKPTQPQITIPIQATIFSGKDENYSEEEIYSWNTAFSTNIKKQVFPGNHFFLHNKESMPNVLSTITRVLSKT